MEMLFTNKWRAAGGTIDHPNHAFNCTDCCSLGSPNVVGNGGDNLSIRLRLCATPTAAGVSAAASVAPGQGRGIMHMQVAAQPALCTTHVGGRVVIGQLTEY